jgi:hypothetical protein
VTALGVVLMLARQESVLSTPPTSALVPRGHGVQLVRGGAARLVPAETGLFASGRFEVTGDGIAEGVGVGVPW